MAVSQIVVFGAGAHPVRHRAARAPSSPGRVKFATPARHRPRRHTSSPSAWNVRPTGNLSLVDVERPGLSRLSSRHSPRQSPGSLVVPVQFVQIGSPAAVTVAVFTVGFAAFAATATGTVITTGPLVPGRYRAARQTSSPRWPGQPLKVPPVAVIARWC